MDKRLLIGVSLCAVVLLVLGSLNNVVGYQPVKSTVNDSPLFRTRIQRAINQQQNSLIFQYLGGGGGNPLQFPIRDNQTEQLKKAIDTISKMDDKTFTQFTKLCIQRIRQDKSYTDVTRRDIVKNLYALRIKPEIIKTSFFNRDNITISRNNSATSPNGELPTEASWIPGCWVIRFTLFIVSVILLILIYIWPTSAVRSCNGPTDCVVPCSSFRNGQCAYHSNLQ